MCNLHSLMLPKKFLTQSPHPIHTLFRVPQEGMVEMGCQDEMVGMESQGDKERGEPKVCRDHLAPKVYKSTIDYP